MNMSTRRITGLRQRIKKENLDGMVITHGDHVRYLTGYTGTNGLLVVTMKEALFFTDFRYTDQAKKQVKGAKCLIADKGDLIANLQNYPKLNGMNWRYGFAPDYFTVGEFNHLAGVLDNAIMVEAGDVLRDLGWVKEKNEIQSIEKAVEISDEALARVLGLVKPGIRESELAAELEYQMIMLGSEKRAFETIVASGYRSAMPHGVASQKKLKKDEFVTFDFGATVDGYVSDITRTVVVGKATKRQKRVYDIVLRSQLAGIKKVKAGVMGREVDETCRKIIRKAGYGKNFGHGTGHGIGFYIHTGPRVSPISEDKLQANNVITIEPGIYISGWGGVRIEDDVVVTRKGGRVLNKAEKKLLEL
ncbi:M24 family metallopeptidase [candidate division GN15 bacterium]|nr:M24 family metallopeptidase [candidate division GN15 bacterium]